MSTKQFGIVLLLVSLLFTYMTMKRAYVHDKRIVDLHSQISNLNQKLIASTNKNIELKTLLEEKNVELASVKRDANKFRFYSAIRKASKMNVDMNVTTHLLGHLEDGKTRTLDHVARLLAITEVESSWRPNQRSGWADGPLQVGRFWITSGSNSSKGRKLTVTGEHVPNAKWLRDPTNNFRIGERVLNYYMDMALKFMDSLKNDQKVPFYVHPYKNDPIGLALYLYNNGPNTRSNNRKIRTNFRYSEKVKRAHVRYITVLQEMSVHEIVPYLKMDVDTYTSL